VPIAEVLSIYDLAWPYCITFVLLLRAS